MTEKKIRTAAIILVVLSAAGVWAASRLTWVTAHVFDDKSGDSTHNLVGAVWNPAGTPLALAMIASLIVTLAVPPLVRRLVGIVIALLAAVASFRSVQILGQQVDLFRAQQLLSTGAASQKATDSEHISDWATVMSADVHNGPVILCVIVAALGVAGGVLMAMRPGGADKGYSRYETPERRRQGAKEDLVENPDSGRVLWDALDAGIDPTEESGQDQ